MTIVYFNILQPIARLRGRLKYDLTPWRDHGKGHYAIPVVENLNVWCDNWVAPEVRLENIESNLRADNACIERGDNYARWDLLIKGGSLGSVKIFMAAEDHEGGKQFLRFRFVPKLSLTAIFLLSFHAVLLTIALLNNAIIPAMIFACIFLILLIRVLEDFGKAYEAAKIVKKQSELK